MVAQIGSGLWIYMNSRSQTHWMPTNFGSRRQVARGAWQDAARALNDLKWLVSEKWNIHPSTGVKVRFALLEPWTDATCHWVIPHQSEGPSAASQAPSQWGGLGFPWDDYGINGWKNSKSNLRFLDIHCPCTCNVHLWRFIIDRMFDFQVLLLPGVCNMKWATIFPLPFFVRFQHPIISAYHPRAVNYVEKLWLCLRFHTWETQLCRPLFNNPAQQDHKVSGVPLKIFQVGYKFRLLQGSTLLV